MTELTESIEQQQAAWIVRGAPTTSPYSIRVDVSPANQSATAPSDWSLVLDDNDHITAVGRILRIRSDIKGRTIYFDQFQTIDPGAPLSKPGLTVPTASVMRLPWDDFLRALTILGVANPNAVPLSNDVTYVRDLLELSVRDDLLGPAEGPHELIKDMSVRDRYLVGKLAPRRPDEDQTAQVEPASAADEPGDLEDERTASLHEPGAEFASATGRVVPEDDTLDEIDTTNNQSLVPSSMGLTFCVAPGVETLTVDARWGRYDRVPNDEHDIVKTRRNRQTGREEEVKVRVWQRFPCGGPVRLPLVDGQ